MLLLFGDICLSAINQKENMGFTVGNEPILICREERPWETYRHPYYKRASAAGIKTIWFKWRTPIRLWNGKQAIDEYFKLLDEHVHSVLADVPDAKFMFQILTTVKCYQKGCDHKHNCSFVGYPGQREIWPPKMVLGDRISSVSKSYRENTVKSLTLLGKHLIASDYADHIAGFVVAGGNGEWFSYYDFSDPARIDYQEWLKNKYNTPAILQKAWKTKSQILFKDISFPKWEELTADGIDGGFIDPGTNRRLIDYWEYHHTRLGPVASQFIATLKNATQRKYPVGMWGGGVGPVALPIRKFRRKGKDANPAFEMWDDPNIDFFAFPYSYEERQAGGVFFRSCGSAVLRRKGQICEDDTRTAQATKVASFSAWEKFGDNYGQASTENQAVEILKRNFAGMFCEGGTGISWFSMAKGLWFDSPEVIKVFGNFSKIIKEYPREKSKSEIAVIISKETRYYQDMNNYNFSKQPRTIIELARIGAPVTFYDIRDLMQDNFPFDKYKMYIFIDDFYMSEQERQVINTHVKNNNRMLVWYYASGYVTDHSLSTQAMSEMIGMNIDTFGKTMKLIHGMDVVLDGNEHWLTKFCEPTRRIVEPHVIAPVFWVNDKSAQVLATGFSTAQDAYDGYTYNKPAICIKKMSDWTSVWSGISYLPAGILRNIAKQAGVHIYSCSGDQVFAGTDLFAMHAAYTGKRKIKFPIAVDILDALSQKQIYKSVTDISIELKKGQTAFWIVTPSGE